MNKSALAAVFIVLTALSRLLAGGPETESIPKYPSRWDDLRFPLVSLVSGSTIRPPSVVKFTDNGAGSDGVFSTSFSGTKEQEVFAAIQIPHAWDGSDVDLHVHWSPTTTATAAITFGVEYSVAKTLGTFSATTIATISAAPGGTINRHSLSDICTIPGHLLNDSAMIIARIFRSGNTDANNDAVFVHEFDVHYRTNGLGSINEYGDK